MNLQPLEDRIVVRPGEAEETTVSGLVIPDTAKEKPQQGEVLAVGPGRRSEHTGELIPVDVAVGDVVLYSKYGGTEVTVDGEDLLVLSSRDVLAKVARREEEVATNHDSGARGGRQRIPRPATARAGAAAPWASFASRRQRRSPSTRRAGPLRRLRTTARAAAPAGRPRGRGAPARLRGGRRGAHRAHPAARDDAVAPGRDRVPGRQGRAHRRPRRRATPRSARRRRRSACAASSVDVDRRARRRSARSSGSSRSRRSSGSSTAARSSSPTPREVDRVFDVALAELLDRRGVPRGALGRGASTAPSAPCSSSSSPTRRSGARPRGS